MVVVVRVVVIMEQRLCDESVDVFVFLLCSARCSSDGVSGGVPGLVTVNVALLATGDKGLREDGLRRREI